MIIGERAAIFCKGIPVRGREGCEGKSLGSCIKAGRDRSGALRLARNETKAKYPNPLFWLCFYIMAGMRDALLYEEKSVGVKCA